MSEAGHDFLYFSDVVLGCIRMVFFFFGRGVGESSHLFFFEMKMENLGGGGRTRGEPARCLDFCQVRMRTAAGLITGIPHNNVATETRPEASY